MAHKGWLVLVILVAVGCSKEPSARTPLPSHDAGAGTGSGTAAAEPRCTSPQDCVISCIESESDCCGDLCGCTHPYHRERAATLEQARQKSCADKVEECPVADCDLPANLVPSCVDGACTAIELPRRTVCTADDQCVLSAVIPDQCCPELCGPSENAWHRADLASFEAWRTAQCGAATCDKAKCAQVTTTLAPKCENGWCVAR